MAALERIDLFRVRRSVPATGRLPVRCAKRLWRSSGAGRRSKPATSEHTAYGRLADAPDELEDVEARARGALYRTEVARAKVEASPPARVLQERAETARVHVDEVSARKPSQRLLLAALTAAAVGVTLGVLVNVLVGVAMLLIAGGLAIFGVTRRDQQAIGESVEALRTAEAAVATDRESRIRAADEAHTGALRAYEAAARATGRDPRSACGADARPRERVRG